MARTFFSRIPHAVLLSYIYHGVLRRDVHVLGHLSDAKINRGLCVCI